MAAGWFLVGGRWTAACKLREAGPDRTAASVGLLGPGKSTSRSTLDAGVERRMYQMVHCTITRIRIQFLSLQQSCDRICSPAPADSEPVGLRQRCESVYGYRRRPGAKQRLRCPAISIAAYADGRVREEAGWAALMGTVRLRGARS